MRLLAALLLIPSTAHADGWLVAEAPAALVVSDVQAAVFRPGMMPAVGAYAENERIALGVRLRAGVLRNGPAPGDNREDPGVGGLFTGGLAIRVSRYGGWVELVGGAGITGRDFVPAVEAGIGWSMPVGTLDIGSSIRYLRVVSRDSMDAFGTAELALVGIDVRFGRQRPERSPRVLPRVVAPVEVAAVEVPVVRDADVIVDGEASCAAYLDGCPISEAIVIADDRIVLDDRVLFDFNRARVRSRGREIIRELVTVWHEHPDWRHITIEGHADVRGSDQYNLELSQIRAERVRKVMIELGCPGDHISAVGHGRARVRDSADTDAAHQRNRRVEFVIERGGQP